MKYLKGFTLAEVLITLGVIGVVAAIILPNFISDISKRIQDEQARSVKYKLTLATDKMKSMGLINSYPTTQDFVNELSKHLKLAKVCSNNLSDCWPTDIIYTADTQLSVNTLTTGEKLKSIVLGSKNAETVGIVTADGTPMLLAYSNRCTPLEPERTYSWTVTDDNKPITNATTNCITAIFDTNGAKKPNKIGKDVRLLNSVLGYVYTNPKTINDCSSETMKKYGLKYCTVGEYYAGSKKYCNDLELKLPDRQFMSIVMGSMVGKTEFDTNLIIANNSFYHCVHPNKNYYCIDTVDPDALSKYLPVVFWINEEKSSTSSSISYSYPIHEVATAVRTNYTVRVLCLPN